VLEVGPLDLEDHAVEKDVGDGEGLGDAGQLKSGLVAVLSDAAVDAGDAVAAREKREGEIVTVEPHGADGDVGFFDAGLLENLGIRRAAADGDDAGAGGEVLTDLLVAVDDDDVVLV
jgi:hypothetical protein